jgi:16S rRNA (guanine966-N2)-methyltransferase
MQLAKKSIFDTLGEEVTGATFLDLFAGAGGIGIEALSRGARRVVFVEQDHRILKALRTNLGRCGFAPDVAVVRMGDAVRYLRKLASGDEYFDIIFADPPYAGNLAQEVVSIVEGAARPLCGLLVVEHDAVVVHDERGPLEKSRTRRFGQTHVTMFRPKRGAA